VTPGTPQTSGAIVEQLEQVPGSLMECSAEPSVMTLVWKDQPSLTLVNLKQLVFI
jgi:hypothetical protein